ncbi:PREDICTED: uncharacterized protein LOC107334943 [Acropora digitifera]|uniref:uncharacterized protein LOC107334943 n=1 Tax=Acropora digitifera TaxID=70779 RepID=UPI00077B05A0|nr:PREDICTED: uncharacterized protein LOC107334943 [Acropora digitifera]
MHQPVANQDLETKEKTEPRKTSFRLSINVLAFWCLPPYQQRNPFKKQYTTGRSKRVMFGIESIGTSSWTSGRLLWTRIHYSLADKQENEVILLFSIYLTSVMTNIS